MDRKPRVCHPWLFCFLRARLAYGQRKIAGETEKADRAAGKSSRLYATGLVCPWLFLLVTGVKEMKMSTTVSIFLPVLDYFTRKHNNRDVQLRFYE